MKIVRTNPLLNTPALRVKLVCAVLAAASLSACAPLMLGGAAAGAFVATDRRTSGAQVEDQGIELKASNRLGEAFAGRAHINVNAYNRMVLLTGEVPAEPDRLTAEQITSRVENVGSVVNQLVVLPNSSLSTRSSDVLLAGKVRATLVDARDVISSAFDIVVESGTVYLMGIVSEREGAAAATLAAGVEGVSKVVKVFEYISEDEVKRLNTTPAAASSGQQRP